MIKDFAGEQKLTHKASKRFRLFPFFLLFLISWSWLVWDSLSPHLPKNNYPPKLYSNQCRQDIRSTLLSAIKGATHSIHLVMFGLSDRPILNALSKKIGQNVPTSIYYDTSGSPKAFPYLEKGDLHPIKKSGLLHQKILILDEKMVFMGSANMTTASLRMHDNLVVGFVSEEVAKFLQAHKPYTPGYLKTNIGDQETEVWLLPDPRGIALADLRKKIRSAEHSLKIALFTFTHLGLVEELIHARDRGVSVSVIIDLHSGLGASAEAIEKLKKAGVPVFLSKGVQLLHHKFAYIDEKMLITGSANWTKAAFQKNSDCLVVLHELNAEQKKFMKRLWKQLETAAK